MARITIQLECMTCRNRNYSTSKNKTSTPDRIALKKYCRHCRKHTEHKETK